MERAAAEEGQSLDVGEVVFVGKAGMRGKFRATTLRGSLVARHAAATSQEVIAKRLTRWW